MKNIMLLVLFIMACPSLARASLKTKIIEYKQGTAILEGYLAYDDSFTGKRPGVLVVHEWMGLNDYARMRADMLASLGYVAFAADIYGKGIRPQTVKDAADLSSQYKNDRLLLRKRVNAGLDALKIQTNVDPSRLAAIGYCFGGTAAMELGRSGADVKGIAIFHGGLSTPTPQDAKNIKADVLVLHGADDPFVLAQEVAAFEQEMKDDKVRYKLIKYPGAVHGFTNSSNRGEIAGALYNADADQGSWQEMKVFFSRIFNK